MTNANIYNQLNDLSTGLKFYVILKSLIRKYKKTILNYDMRKLEKITYDLLVSEYPKEFLALTKEINDIKSDDKTAQEQMRGKKLGQAIDFRTKLITDMINRELAELNKKFGISITEDFIKQARFAMMNVVRDECSRRDMENTKGDTTEIIFVPKFGELVKKGEKPTLEKKVIILRGKHTDFQVAKGRKDEEQYLVSEALSFLENLAGEDIMRDSRYEAATESTYENEFEILSEGLARAIKSFLDYHKVVWAGNFGLNSTNKKVHAVDQITRTEEAIALLGNQEVWNAKNLSDSEQDRRISLLNAVENALANATESYSNARVYRIGKKEIKVAIH